MSKFNRKLKKLLNNPRLFFSDMYLKRQFKSITVLRDENKKLQGRNKFIIICPVYNVEKYINDFFMSICNQSLDFQKYIHILFIDDGSTDLSAQIIHKIKSQYPNNITYLYKENGGLSSCRNFGLDYIYDNNLAYDYLTFTDPDDFVNKDYFLELDKLFTKNPNCQIISCNLIYFYENENVFKDIHPLKYRYNETHIRKSSDLGEDILLSAATAVYKISLINDLNIRFDEDVKPSFEDCKFNNQILTTITNLDVSIGFLKEAQYFYRQREDNSSLMNNSWSNKGLFDAVLEKGVIDMLEFSIKNLGYIPRHIQRVALFHCIGYYRRLVNNMMPTSLLLDNEEIKKFKILLSKVFLYIDSQEIFTCVFPNLDRKIKIGLYGFYKKERYPISYVNISKIDILNKKIIFSFTTCFIDDLIEIRSNGNIVDIIEEKFVSSDFLGDLFYFDRFFSISYKEVYEDLQIFVNGKKANIYAFSKGYTGGAKVIEFIRNMNKKVICPNLTGAWILMDRINKADDNAEHFYRYMMLNHPEQKIFFTISKSSKDWERLYNDGFHLLDYNSPDFYKELSRCKYIISSHLLIWNVLIKKYGTQSIFAKRKIWLQHGVICNDNSKVINTKDIDLMITSTKDEYNSIAASFTGYNLLPSQLILSGLPRHDNLLSINNELKTEKMILVMPTWRTWLKDSDFEVSDYFIAWNNFLSSKKLMFLLQKYGYKLVFSPHEEVQGQKHLFYENDSILIHDNNETIQNLFAKAEIMITDYSSVAFEMAFLRKLVMYYQFDKQEFFSNHYKKGYFDFDNNGFGPCIDSHEQLLDEIEKYFMNTEKYYHHYSNRMNIFINREGNSCEFIFNKILELN